VGGEDPVEDEAWRTVEVYDFATQQWILLLTEMGTARHAHGVVVCENKLENEEQCTTLPMKYGMCCRLR
jgi:hypothetical protein